MALVFSPVLILWIPALALKFSKGCFLPSPLSTAEHHSLSEVPAKMGCRAAKRLYEDVDMAGP